MMEWIVILSFPALVAFLKPEPALNRAWTFLCSALLGTFAALSFLPWTLAKVIGFLSPHNPYNLLIAFFAVSVVATIVLYQIFCRCFLSGKKEPSFLSFPGAIPERLMIFGGMTILVCALLLSVCALPSAASLPMVRNPRLQNTGSKILALFMPKNPMPLENRTMALLKQYPRHLRQYNTKVMTGTAETDEPVSAPKSDAAPKESGNRTAFEKNLKRKISPVQEHEEATPQEE